MIRVIGIYCFFTISIHGQVTDIDSILMKKVIDLTKQEEDVSSYKLKISQSNSFLKKYFDYRYKNKPFYTTITYDSITENIGVDSLELRQNFLKWNQKYKTINKLFSKEDIIHMITTPKKNVKDFEKVNFSDKNENEKNFNLISIPNYNIGNTHSIVIHKDMINTTIFIFKKEDDEWLLLDRIKKSPLF